MEDLPRIPFVRNACKGMTEEEIKEQERLVYELCDILRGFQNARKLINKNNKLK